MIRHELFLEMVKIYNGNRNLKLKTKYHKNENLW